MGTGGQRGGQRAQLCAGLCAGAVQPGFNFDLDFGAFSLRGGQFCQCIHSGRMEHEMCIRDRKSMGVMSRETAGALIEAAFAAADEHGTCLLYTSRCV